MKFILLLLASVEAIKLDGVPWQKGQLPWGENDFFDKNHADVERQVELFGAARRGNPITKEMEAE